VKIDRFREPRAGGKFAVVLAVLGVLAVAAAFGMSASAARAAGPGKPATVKTYTGTPTTLTPLSNATQIPHGFQATPQFIACLGVSEILPNGPCTLAPPSEEDDPGTPSQFPNAPGGPTGPGGPGGPGGPSGKLGANFDGVSDFQMRSVTGFHETPPDQALCVGPAGPLEGAGVTLGVPGNTTVVVEEVNDVTAVYAKDGTQLFIISNANLFSDGNSSGDIECNYDKQSNTYFFTEIGAANNEYFTSNLAVLNSQGYSAYNVDTAEGGFCFPDFPHQGIDNNALYITINEFCGANEDFFGANVYAISKQQLVTHTDGSGVNGVLFTLGDNYYSFRGATGDPTNTEYLLASEQNDVTQNALDIAWVTGDQNLTKGNGPVILSVTSIPSETFSEPIEAPSTGDDSTCVRTFHTHATFPDDQTWCSVPEKTLDATDMRLEQVTYLKGKLYSSLDTSLTVGHDPTVVDGSAWFQVDPKALKVTQQGYVGVAGTNLLMPSMVMSNPNTLLMGFSATSSTLNPSAGYVVSKDGGKHWSSPTWTAVGSGPHVSFSTFQPGYLRRRWGDYSRIAVDPSSGDVWMADEYIPGGAAGADQVDNWGTRVWQIK
jgi:hypothetical protein